MVKIDITFDEKTMNIFQNFIGKKFEKYKSDPFVYSPSVYGIVGLYIDKSVYKLTNFTEVMDYYGAKEDVAIFKFENSIDEEIKTFIINGKMIETSLDNTISKIQIVNENQKTFYKGEQDYDVWVTRGIIFFFADGLELSFEKPVWFSEEIYIDKGYNLISRFTPEDEFPKHWENGYIAECTRKIIEIK